MKREYYYTLDIIKIFKSHPHTLFFLSPPQKMVVYIPKGKGIKSTKIVTHEEGKPQIIVKDISLSEKYYRVTGLEVDDKKYYIYHQNEEDFFRSLNKLKRNYHFRNQDVNVLGTKTHRYASTTFIDKGFEP